MAVDDCLLHKPSPGGEPDGRADRAPWIRPEVEELPPLTDLTLMTGDPIGGGGDTGGGGTTVF